MLKLFCNNLRGLYRRLGWPVSRRKKPNIVVKKHRRLNSRIQTQPEIPIKALRIATFNASLFSMAQVVPPQSSHELVRGSKGVKSTTTSNRPKSILKQSPLHPNQDQHRKLSNPRLRVSINLPENEISLSRSGHLVFDKENSPSSSSQESISRKILKGKAPLCSKTVNYTSDYLTTRTIFDVLREVDADILALQDVKAEEEKNMKPLSDLARALGMTFVFAESWAPQFGNAILSKWPIKKWKAHKIFDDSDFRIVLKATIDVPQEGEINVLCTVLDHLDENLRMEQVNAIIGSSSVPHILAGGLNSLDDTDYSHERWEDIKKYYEEMGKPTPKSMVMKQLKNLGYRDAKEFTGACESVVMIAKGQSVQGTCRYGTRVDYILSSCGLEYKFVDGSYSVISSKGCSDHHIVKVNMIKVPNVTCPKSDKVNMIR